MPVEPTSLLVKLLTRSQSAFQELSQLAAHDRSQMLRIMAAAIAAQQDNILEANTLDLESSREMAVPELILDWLKLTPERLQAVTRLLDRLAEIPDPLQQIRGARYQAHTGQVYTQVLPLGVIAFVYEALPEFGAIAAGLCCRTGNSLVLKGSIEASHTNEILVQALQIALSEAGFPPQSLTLLPSEQGGTLRDLVSQPQLQLVIPYGRPSLVQQVLRQSTVPVLRTAIGNCYLYWSASSELDLARSMILHSHDTEPDAVNAIEKVLVPRHYNPSALTMLWKGLVDEGFEVRLDDTLSADYPDFAVAEPSEWQAPYLKPVVAFKVVDDLTAAIAWINTHSSGHADALITDSYPESQTFVRGVNSASVFVNASPCFYRNPPYGDAIALGMSGQLGHYRGRIGLDTFLSAKTIIQGSGLL